MLKKLLEGPGATAELNVSMLTRSGLPFSKPLKEYLQRLKDETGSFVLLDRHLRTFFYDHPNLLISKYTRLSLPADRFSDEDLDAIMRRLFPSERPKRRTFLKVLDDWRENFSLKTGIDI